MQPTIERIEIFVVDPGKGVRWTDRAKTCAISTTIARITDSDGAQGVAGMDNFTFGRADRSVLESVRSMWPWLEGSPIDCGEELAHDMRVGVVFPHSLQPVGLIDTALWDLRARRAELPLWKFLGGKQDQAPAYASLETMPSEDDYVDIVASAVSQGFRAVKLHAFGDPRKDISLATRLRKIHPDLVLMHDAEGVYSHQEALQVGLALDELGFHWYEAPLNDFDLQGYRELREKLTTPVLPAGYALGDHRQIAQAIRHSPWSACRSEIGSTQGISSLNKMAALARSFDLNLEPVTYGHSLYATAGLHFILGHPNTSYFEIAYPMEDWEYGVVDPVRPDASGVVRAPEGNGIGLTIDWEKIESMTAHSLVLGG